MNVLRKLRGLSILLAVAIFAGQLCIVNVNAAQGVQQAPIGTKLSGFRLTDLDAPIPGRDLDFKARVRTNENVTWEIPVIWTDENGNTAYTAKPGHTYYPNFAFYIPEGYEIDPKALKGKMLVQLPYFLIDLYGEDSVLFTSDASLGVTYITLTQAIEAIAAKEKAARERYDPAPDSIINVPKKEYNDPGYEGESSSSAPAPAPAKQVSQTVRVHCSQDVIDKFSKSPEVLENLVTLIKNKLQPQAVNLLQNGFGAFGDVEESTFGEKLGLYIYNKTGSIDGVTTPEDVLAYVSGKYFTVDGNTVFKYVMAIDTDSFMEQDENGNWRYKEGQEVNRDNTIIHEMMHAFMDDYTRRGMLEDNSTNPGVSGGDGFPTWFEEGLAVAVENVYQFRAYGLQTMGKVDPSDFDGDLDRFASTVEYDRSSVISRYGYNPTAEGKGDYRYDLMFSDEVNNGNSAYVSGYLAVIYLGYLAAVHEGTCTAESTNVDTAAIRDGLSQILGWIHEGYSLDSVIQCISTPDSSIDDKTTYGSTYESTHYKSTQNFQDNFIKGTGEAGTGGVIFTTGATLEGTELTGGRSVLGSADFVATYLNYLESKSGTGNYTQLANGSILRDDQNYQTPLNETDAPKPGIFVIGDETGDGGYVESTATDCYAYDHTGGRTIDHVDEQNTNANVIPLGGGDQGAAAARSESVAPSSDETSPDKSDPSQSVAEPVVSEEPASAPESDVPVPEIVGESAADAVEVVDITQDPIPVIVETVILPDTGDLIVLPQDVDAITPEEIVPAVSEPVSDEVTPPTGDAPSPDEGSSEGGSDDGGSDDGGSDEGSSDGGSEE